MDINQGRLALLAAPNTPLWTGTVDSYDADTYQLTTTTTAGTIPANPENLLLVREGVELTRVRAVSGTTFTLGETPVAFTAADTVALYDIRLPWPRYQRISDGTVYKDFDIAFPTPWQRELPPTPLLLARTGTNDWQEAIYAETGEDIDLDASRSFANLDDAAPLVYTWDAGTGGTITGSGVTVTAAYTTGGFRYIQLTVTDDHGSTCERYLPVWIGDDDAIAAIAKCTGRWDANRGWTIDVEAQADVEILQYTPAAIVDVETQEVIFFGFIVPNARTETFERTTTTMTIQSALAFSKYIHAYPFLVTEVTGAEEPSEWAELYEPTLARALWFLLFWHSTLPEVVNADLGAAPIRAIAGQEFTLGSLPQQADAILKSAFWQARCHRAGGFAVRTNPLYLDDAAWAAHTALDLSAPADLRDAIQQTYAVPTINQVRLGGVYQDTGGTFEPALAQAPIAPGPWGSPSEINNLAPASAAELREWAGRHIAVENTADEINATPGLPVDPATWAMADLPDHRIAIERCDLDFNPDTMRWRITLGGRTYGRTASAVDVPVPPEIEYPTPPAPPALPPIWDPIPDESGLYALVATSQGLYRSDDIELDAISDPYWYPWGDELHITVAAFDPASPEALQLGISPVTPGDQTTDRLYIRRPTVTGDDWQQILTMAEALTEIGYTTTGKEKFRFCWYDPTDEIVYLTMEVKNTGQKFVFHSDDYGANWTGINSTAFYAIGQIVSDSTGKIYLAVCSGLGGIGRIWESTDHGAGFTAAYTGRGGGWYPLMFFDRSTDTLYAGDYTVDSDYRLLSNDGGFAYIDTPSYLAGIINTVGGCGYAIGDFIRTVRDGTLYYTDNGGTTWGSASLSPETNRAMDGNAEGYALVARQDTVVGDPHLVFATFHGATMYSKGGASPESAATTDSIPYDAIVADLGVAIGSL